MILILSPSASFCNKVLTGTRWTKKICQICRWLQNLWLIPSNKFVMKWIFCRCKDICRWIPILSLSDKFLQGQKFYETPPGSPLILKARSCFSYDVNSYLELLEIIKEIFSPWWNQFLKSSSTFSKYRDDTTTMKFQHVPNYWTRQWLF